MKLVVTPVTIAPPAAVAKANGPRANPPIPPAAPPIAVAVAVALFLDFLVPFITPFLIYSPALAEFIYASLALTSTTSSASSLSAITYICASYSSVRPTATFSISLIRSTLSFSKSNLEY